MELILSLLRGLSWLYHTLDLLALLLFGALCLFWLWEQFH